MGMVHTHVVCEVGYARTQANLESKAVALATGGQPMSAPSRSQRHIHTKTDGHSLATGGQPMSAPSRSQRHIHTKTDGRRQGVKPIRAKPRRLKNCGSPSSESESSIAGRRHLNPN
jgi:hypothetical protein